MKANTINFEDYPVEYIELNMLNYSHEEVVELNEWAIWAVAKIDDMESVALQSEIASSANHTGYLSKR